MTWRGSAGLSSLGVVKGDHIACIANNRAPSGGGRRRVRELRLMGAALSLHVRAAARQGLGVHPRATREAKILFVANNQILDKVRGYLKAIPSLKHIVAMDGGTNGSAGDGITTYKALLESGKTAPVAAVGREDIAGLIYTSGTTGNPKGVMLSHFNIASNIGSVLEVVPLEGTDRSLSFLPWAHVFGQTVELHGLLSTGASTAIAEAVDKIIDNLAEVRPTLLFSVPRIFNKLYTAVQKQIASKPKGIQVAVEQALRIAGKQRRGKKISVAEHAAFAAVDLRGLRQGPHEVRRPAQIRLQRRRGDLQGGGRVHRHPRDHRLRGVRAHRDLPDRHGELAGRAADRERRAGHPRRARRDRHDGADADEPQGGAAAAG